MKNNRRASPYNNYYHAFFHTRPLEAEQRGATSILLKRVYTEQREESISSNFHGTSANKPISMVIHLSHVKCGLPLLELPRIVIVNCLTSSHKNYLSTWLYRFSGDTPVVGCIATEPLVFPIHSIAYALPSLLRNHLNLQDFLRRITLILLIRFS